MVTPKQIQILDFIKSYQEKNGFAPSQKEIAQEFQYSSLGTVQNYLVRLKKQGLIDHDWNAKRGIKINDFAMGENSIFPEEGGPSQLPLYGVVAAGRPIEAVEQREYIDVPASFLSPSREQFALLVNGSSMIEDAILDGDYIIVERRVDAQNGQIVVAMVEGEATVKRMYRKKSEVELRPSNQDMNSIFVRNKDLEILGIVRGVIRKF